MTIINKTISVIKSNGDREEFDENKLRASLIRSGATPEQTEKVVEHVLSELENDMTTDHIYRHSFSLLKTLRNPKAMRRYSLRHALLDLGPTGFPFEKFLSEMFKCKGYEVMTDQVVLGRCVQHETDLIAYNESKLLMVEAKFHNQYGEKTDLKVALYVKARYDDLSEQHFNYGKTRLLDEGWIITNTKFTENAIKFGQCSGLKLIGWNYPEKGSLRDIIEDYALHPITCLPNLSSSEKTLLLNNNMVICKQVISASASLISVGISEERARELEAQAKIICDIS